MHVPWVRRRRYLILLQVALTLVIFEIGSRWYVRYVHGMPLQEPDAAFYRYYPEMRRLDAAEITKSDDFYDILFLGGSVLDGSLAEIRTLLESENAVTGLQFRVHSVASSAHSSLDSQYKYKHLADDQRFDLVVFYHGINEVRANNIPTGNFREDYTHYSWYGQVRFVDSYGSSLPYLRFPFVFATGIDRVLPLFRSSVRRAHACASRSVA